VHSTLRSGDREVVQHSGTFVALGGDQA
jgi:hypothetical protein